MAPRLGPLVLLCLVVACAVESPPITVECASCYDSTNDNFSFITFRRAWGNDVDEATWRFSVDELVCSLTHETTQTESSALLVTCFVQDQPDDKSVPLFVNVANGYDGFGPIFRVDTMGRATSHVRVERDGVLADELDRSPTFTGSQTCGSFQYDLGGERELLVPAGP